jgi:diguanylate cyclase (GGDEF)-like protein/PAS domain S-box-containing protein
MKIAPIPVNEHQRIASLIQLDVLDSGPEEEFDALIQAASILCGVPISLISLVDSERQWFKANIGIPGVSETSRDIAFCSHAILGEGIFEVPDASLDERFFDNPLVTDKPDIRFYAGAPIVLKDGSRVGTLCVIDREPKTLSENQKEVLGCLAIAAAKALDSRRIGRQFDHERQARADVEEKFKILSEFSPIGVFYANAQGECTYTNRRWQEIYDLSIEQSLGNGWSDSLHPEDKEKVFHQWSLTAQTGHVFDMEFRIETKQHSIKYVHSKARPIFDKDGTLIGYVGSVEDATARVNSRETIRKSQNLLNRTGKMAGIGGWEVDLKTNSIYWSAETCHIHEAPIGYQPSLENALDFYSEESKPLIEAAVKKAIETGEPWDLELSIINFNSELVWVRAVGSVEFENGKAIRLVGTFQNINEEVKRRKIEQDIKERMKLATDSGCIGIWDLDIETGKLYWDPWMYRLYGVEQFQGDLDNSYWKSRVHPEDLSKVEEIMFQSIEKQVPLALEFRVIWDDQSIHFIKASGNVKYNEHEKPVRIVGANWDVTDARLLSKQLKEKHELLHVTLKSIGDAVITTDANSNIVWLNPVAERMTGWLNHEAENKPINQVFHIVHEETRKPAENPIHVCLEQKKISGIANNILLISRNGFEYGIQDSAAPILNDDGIILGAVLVFHDVTEQRKLSGEMSYRAKHDALTGLVNRAEFETRLNNLLKSSHENHGKNALLYIDLDQFKLVNDACGHAMGDKLLQQVSQLFTETIRSRDTLARLGGDEFAVILERCTPAQASRVAQKICDQMENYRFIHDGRRFRIGASIGLVPVDERWKTTEAILKAADTSCYAAKEAGRNRVHFWFDTDSAMHTRHGEMQWTSKIEQAIDDDRFVLFAQRIIAINIPSNGIHAEVLLRMLDDDGSLIPPGAFLPSAERFHLASRIDKWVLKRSIEWMLHLESPKIIENLSINLSGQSVGDKVFHEWAIELLSSTGKDICKRICLEITETSAITNLQDATIFIKKVQNLGVRVSLDDFGSGASSFGYLKSIPVNFLKIDGQFVKDIITDPLDEVAVRCFIDVAKVVGIQTVAEFVDNEEVLSRLKTMGVHYAQGYLLHKPSPINELIGVTVL